MQGNAIYKKARNHIKDAGKEAGSFYSKLIVILILLNCVFYGLWNWGRAPGEDLGSSYVACILLRDDMPQYLYEHHPEKYNEVGDGSMWNNVARSAGYKAYTHPYVQAPLWAYILKPFCEPGEFISFKHAFLLLDLICLAGTIFLTAKMWAPSFIRRPAWLIVLLVAFKQTAALRYTFFLIQTHPIFIFLAILAVFLANKERAGAAGLVLAVATLVKITPGILALYWLVSGQRRAFFSFAACLLALMIASIGLVGMDVNLDYLHNLQRITSILLVSYNNQSLSGAIFGELYAPDEFWRFTMFPAPIWIKLLETALLGLTFGYITIVHYRYPHISSHIQGYCVAALLLAATMFSNIAWLHYYIILIIPAMVLLDSEVRKRASWLLPLIIIVWLLNITPFSVDPISHRTALENVPRSQFTAGMMCWAALLYIIYSTVHAIEHKKHLPAT